MRIPRLLETFKNALSPSVVHLESGTHVERVGLVLYFQFAKMVAETTELPLSTEKVPVFRFWVFILLNIHKNSHCSHKLFTKKRYKNMRYKKFLYHYYAIAAYKPLRPNIVHEYSSFQQYRETLLKKFNNEIYQWPMLND